MALGKFEGRITFTAAQSIELTENGSSVGFPEVAAGDYYLTTASTGLLATLKTQLEASGAGTYTCSLSDDTDAGTGKATISATGIAGTGFFELDFTSAITLRDAIGFTANTSGAATYTGAEHSDFLWLPNVNRTDPQSPEAALSHSTIGVPVASSIVTQSPDGTTRVVAYGTRYEENIVYKFLLGNKTRLALESVTNESLERFWDTTISLGYPVRYHPDRSSDSVYATYRIMGVDALNATPDFAGWVSGASSRWGWSSRAVKLI